MQDTSLLEKYLDIVKNSTYFEIGDVDKLNLPYDWLIVLGEKNIGKTYQLYQLVKNLKPGEKFAYMRITHEQAKNASYEWINQPDCPFYAVSNNIYMKPKKADNSIIGRVLSFNTKENTSSSFDNSYKFLFFDEFIPIDSTKKIYQVDLIPFLIMVSNISRNNQDFKVYLFGNFNNDTPLLSDLNISPLKPILHESHNYDKDKKFSFLFINTLGIFKGVERQPALLLLKKLNPILYEQLSGNRPLLDSDMVIREPSIISCFESMLKLSDGKTIYELKYQDFVNDFNKNITRFLLTENRITITNYNDVIFTNNLNASNLYNFTYQPEKEFKNTYSIIVTLARHGSLFVSNLNVLNNFIDSFKIE